MTVTPLINPPTEIKKPNPSILTCFDTQRQSWVGGDGEVSGFRFQISGFRFQVPGSRF
jgi:hypothetical protein